MNKTNIERPEKAPHGAIYVCPHCSKSSLTLMPGKTSDRGWDINCASSAVLCDVGSLQRSPENGLVIKAEAYEGGDNND